MSIKVKPAPGVKVRDPKTKQHIPEDGVELQVMSSYWARRVISGDVVVVEEKSVQPAKKVSKN